MRVRLYEVGDSSVGFVLRCDQLPLELGVEEQSGRLHPRTPAEPALCRLADDHGQLVFERLDADHAVLVNDAPLASGPLAPGDQLAIEGHRYVVSYEQLGTAAAQESRYQLASLGQQAN